MDQRAAPRTIQSAIAENYAALSETLRIAADYVAHNRIEVATRSLRSVAAASQVSPASFSRLARALGFDDYEMMREQARAELETQTQSFTVKARDLQAAGRGPFLPRQTEACIANIRALEQTTDHAQLEAAADCLAQARSVVIVAALGSAGFADYFAYLTSWFDGKFSVAGRNGVTLASSLARLTPQDAVIVISKAPYANRSIKAVEMAANRGAKIIAVTDSHIFPGLRHADFGFIQQTESPQFFSSYAATLVLIETLVGMLVTRAGPSTEEKIRDVIEQNRKLDEIADP